MSLPLLITDLPVLAGTDVAASTDVIPIVDVSNGPNGTASKITVQELIANTSSFVQSGTGAVATTLQARGRLEVWSADFGHLSSASAATNDAAIVAAITAVYAAGGGTVRMAAGNYSHITVPYNWAAATTVNLKGEGEAATILTKSGGTSTAVLALSVDVGILDVYSTFSDFAIVGNAKGHHGITATRLARVETHNLKISGCDVGFESVGCLIANHYKPDWNSNNIGFRCRKSGTIYANLVQFFGGGILSNTSFGLDIGDASGVHWYGTDIESNGTSLNTGTGNVIIRSTVDDEIGYANISMNGGWCESSFGSNFKVEAASGLSLSVKDTVMVANEAGLAMNVGAIQSLVLDNITAPSASDVVTTAAVNSFVRGGVIYTLTDTATNYVHLGVTTGATTLNEIKGFSVGSSGVSFAVGAPLKLLSGSNGKAGTAALSTGFVVISTTAVTANSMIFALSQADGGAPGWLRITNVTPATSFRIDSSSGTDTSTVAWMIVEKA